LKNLAAVSAREQRRSRGALPRLRGRWWAGGNRAATPFRFLTLWHCFAI